MACLTKPDRIRRFVVGMDWSALWTGFFVNQLAHPDFA